MWRKRRWGLAVKILFGLRCLFVLLALAGSPALAQTPPAAPASAPSMMTQTQMDSMAEQISRSVMQKLHEQGVQPATPAPAPDEAPMDNSDQARFFVRLGNILSAAPALWAQVGEISARLDAPYNDGRSLGSYLALLAASVLLALFAEWLVRLLLAPLRRHLANGMHGLRGLRSLAVLALLEAVPLLAFWIASNATEAASFMGKTPQIQFSVLVFNSLFLWRLLVTAFRITLRPALAAARLPALDDRDANTIFVRVAAGTLVIIAARDFAFVLEAIKSSPEVIGCAHIFGAVVMSLFVTIMCLSMNGAVGRWFQGVINPSRPSPLKASLARHWLFIGVPLFVAFAIADIYGAVVGDLTVPKALSQTLALIVGLLLIESLVHRIRSFLEHRSQDGTHIVHPRGAEALARCVRFGMFIIIGIVLARIWTMDVGGMMKEDDYTRFGRALTTAAITIFGAFCLWELVRYFADRYSVMPRSIGLPPGQGDSDEELQGEAASRIATMMPLLRIAIAVAIIVLTTLTVLSQLGVNVTPLIAGASIFGLAISFGSQTLVKDVVSGVFYLVDDAFRVGEYIDVGKAKGTVEGFTLRSLRLRHQNGPVHTIPYGQLGQVTNYSRDWATIKFPLRFARETDLEKLRKAVKKIGQEMLEDPEMKEEFLTPLKMQGVFDITDNAIIIRFKFTVKPNKPTFIQREALKRLIRILPEQGIEFASGAVAVKNLDGHPNAALGVAVSAAAAAALPTPASAE
jgi:small-conductance mechanosensitive channel